MSTKPCSIMQIFICVISVLFFTSSLSLAATLTISPKPVGGTVTSNVGEINCGDGGTTCTSSNIALGTQVVITATPSQGYVFTSWNAPNGTTSSINPLPAFPMPSTSQSASAIFNANVPGACGTAINNASAVSPAVNLCSAGTATAVSGGAANWNWSCNGSYGGTSANCTAPRSYLLSFAPGNGGLLMGNLNQEITYGGNATPVYAAPSANYGLINWTEGGSVVSWLQQWAPGNVTASHDYVANFGLLNLIVSKPTGGTIVSNPEAKINCGDGGTICSVAYPAGLTFSLSFIPTSINYTYDSWNINGGTIALNNMAIDAPLSGVMNIAVNVTHNPPIDAVCGGDNSAIIPATPVNLCSAGTASPVAGTGPWSWSCDGSYGGVTVNCSARKLVFTALASMATERMGHTSTLLQNGKFLVAGGSNTAGTVLGSAELYDPATNLWSSAGNMTTMRTQHAATLLPDGRVLITGGYDNNFNRRAETEIFDPLSNSWSTGSNMITARDSHTATLLNNGTVLVAGGMDNTTSESVKAEIYDPTTNLWSSEIDMKNTHALHTATLLPNGTVLIVGGANAAAELFNPVNRTWSSAAPATSGYRSHTASLLANGTVLVAGGINSAAAEIYNPTNNSWSSAGTMTEIRGMHSATLLANGKILVTGGYNGYALKDNILTSTELYDPVTNSWSPNGNMAFARYNHTATLLSDGRIIVIGGFGVKLAEAYGSIGSWSSTAKMTAIQNYATSTLLADGNVLVVGGGDPAISYFPTQIYDPATNKWKLAGYTNDYRAYHTATLLPNGNVLVVGGRSYLSVQDQLSTTGTVEIYTPGSANTSWSIVATNVARYSHSATLLPNGKVLIAGGANISGRNHNPVQAYYSSALLYDPAANSWSTAQNMSTSRSGHSATLLKNGKVLVVGGTWGLSCELYNPATDSWSFAANAPDIHSGHSAILLPSGKVLIIGGWANGLPTSSTALYDPESDTWSSAGNLPSGRDSGFSAFLLPNGMVAATGGNKYGSAFQSITEIYDPATNRWFTDASMVSTRYINVVMALTDGNILIAGGDELYGTLAELYHPGSGFSTTRRPIITSATIAPSMPTQLVLTGSNFRGDSEASSGNSQNSSSGYPLVKLQRLDNNQMFFVQPAPNWQWSDATFVSAPLSGIPGGHYRVSVIANGIPSLEKIISLNVHSVGFSAGLGGGLSGNISQYILDGGVSAPVQAIPDPGYVFTNWTTADGLTTVSANPLPGSTITADMKFTANFIIAPVNGACGPSHGVYSASKPVSGLCSIGNASAVNNTVSPWNWTCSGMFNGTTANCSTNAHPSLRISFAGNGTGTVTGTSGINCSTAGPCPAASFPAGTNVILKAFPGIYSVLNSWSTCSGTGDCTVSMNVDKNVTTTFTLATLIKNLRSSQGYSILQEAYLGTVTGDTLMLRITPDMLSGGLNMNRPEITSLTIKGGYDAGYKVNSDYTTMQGALKISFGSLIVEQLIIR